MKRKKVRKKIVLIALLYFSLGVILFQSVGNTIYDIYNKQKEKEELTSVLNDLKEKEDELKATVTKLQDPDYVARYAREKYLYSKDGEIIIRIPE